VIVLDIETNLDHDIIWCAVTWDEGEWFVTWTRDNKGLLQDYLHQHAPVVMHNGIGFDAPVLRKVWEINLYPSQVVDTLVMSRLYKPDIEGGHSLKAWGERLRGDDGKIDFH
jgi:uncharacterized protein YprB with RNaseH-like and TPR domain